MDRTVQFERDAECELPGPFLKKTCSRIATTTRTVADQVKLVAQDINTERGSSIPGCFAVCVRRDRMNSSSKTVTTRKQTNGSKGRKGGARGKVVSDKSSTTDSMTETSSAAGGATRKRRKARRERSSVPLKKGMAPMPESLW